MPLHLEPLDLYEKLQGYSSVLLVSCPICPPISLATDYGKPFMEFFKHGILPRHAYGLPGNETGY